MHTYDFYIKKKLKRVQANNLVNALAQLTTPERRSISYYYLTKETKR